MADSFSQYDEDFFLFIEAGFIAINNTDEDSAIKLFKAAELLRPDNILHKTGMGYMHLCKLEVDKAASLFRDVLEKDPKNEVAKSLLGICLSLSSKETSKGEKMLSDASTGTKDPDIKKLAEVALEFIDAYVKKPASPMDLHTKKSK